MVSNLFPILIRIKIIKLRVIMHVFTFKFGVFILLVLNINVGKCAKILAIHPSPGYSQYIFAEPLLITLAERGHNVTVISAFDTKNVENLTNIVVDVTNGNDDMSEILLELQDWTIYENLKYFYEFTNNLSEKILADPQVQELIHSDDSFDLVIVETFHVEPLQVFAKHFNAPQVLFHSIALNEWNSHLVGNPNLPSYMPNSYGGYTNRMTFGQRFRNTLALWFCRIYTALFNNSAQQKIVDRYFPVKYNLNDIKYNASLLLSCSHVSTTEALALTTSVIEVGGLHIRNKKLPDDVKEFLDSAKDGAIFISMGSNIRMSNLSKKVIQEILEVIRNLKQRVLWKFEDLDIENKPNNLMISSWFPQSDILAHPNTILFISHGGMGSTTEAIYHGVPVVGIPLFVDQFMNVRRLIMFGMGVELPLKELSGKRLEEHIHEILDNPKYKENAEKRSRIMKDRPMKPLDLAVYWIEYILRHDGAHHLKSAILELTWYQLYLLDIIGLLLLIFFCIAYSTFAVFRTVKRLFTSKVKRE